MEQSGSGICLSITFKYNEESINYFMPQLI